MDIIGEAVSNPLSEEELKEDTDAVLAPALTPKIMLDTLYITSLSEWVPPCTEGRAVPR